MRNILIYLIAAILTVSCADMHSPILHASGKIRFEAVQEQCVDPVIIQRMTDHYLQEWTPEMFVRDLDDFHVEWFSGSSSRNVDFIRTSSPVLSPKGTFESVWTTNPYLNNICDNFDVYTEHLCDTVCKIPDFVYSRSCQIDISDDVRDYVEDSGQSVQTIRRTLYQRSFLYVVQVRLKNNAGRVRGAGAFSVTGLAETFNAKNGVRSGETCYIFNGKFYKTPEDDVIAGRFISFGRSSEATEERRNILYVQAVYSSNRRIIPVDVTDQFVLQPRGGLILAEIDVNEFPEPDTEMTDPFAVFVSDYENVEHFYTQF